MKKWLDEGRMEFVTNREMVCAGVFLGLLCLTTAVCLVLVIRFAAAAQQARHETTGALGIAGSALDLAERAVNLTTEVTNDTLSAGLPKGMPVSDPDVIKLPYISMDNLPIPDGSRVQLLDFNHTLKWQEWIGDGYTDRIIALPDEPFRVSIVKSAPELGANEPVETQTPDDNLGKPGHWYVVRHYADYRGQGINPEMANKPDGIADELYLTEASVWTSDDLVLLKMQDEFRLELNRRNLIMVRTPGDTWRYEILIDGKPAVPGPWGWTYVVKPNGSSVKIGPFDVGMASPGQTENFNMYEAYGQNLAAWDPRNFGRMLADQLPQWQPEYDLPSSFFEKGIYSYTDDRWKAVLKRYGFQKQMRVGMMIPDGWEVWLGVGTARSGLPSQLPDKVVWETVKSLDLSDEDGLNLLAGPNVWQDSLRAARFEMDEYWHNFELPFILVRTRRVEDGTAHIGFDGSKLCRGVRSEVEAHLECVKTDG